MKCNWTSAIKYTQLTVESFSDKSKYGYTLVNLKFIVLSFLIDDILKEFSIGQIKR